ncbi:MAG: thioesterase family protein [Coleofasciculaceae cyanobacterium]
MQFTYYRTVRFQDTDAAGVVYFANVLSMCHEAYEASLANFGIELKLFFTNPTIAIPIIHASVDFRRPMYCGDQLQIELISQQLDEHKFEITYLIIALSSRQQPLATALTKHICIEVKNKTRTLLPEKVRHWLSCSI